MTDTAKKSSLELRRRVKKEETAKKKAEKKESKPKVITGDEGEKKVSFEQWWMKINRKVSIKSWMKEIIWVDMKARGLSKSETEDKYNEALKLFGISW